MCSNARNREGCARAAPCTGTCTKKPKRPGFRDFREIGVPRASEEGVRGLYSGPRGRRPSRSSLRHHAPVLVRRYVPQRARCCIRLRRMPVGSGGLWPPYLETPLAEGLARVPEAVTYCTLPIVDVIPWFHRPDCPQQLGCSGRGRPRAASAEALRRDLRLRSRSGTLLVAAPRPPRRGVVPGE